MFNLQDLMDPVYYPMTKAADSFSFQMSLKNKPDEMNWADPFRPDDVVPPHVKQAVVESLNSTAAHYTFPIGDAELRREVAKRVKRVNGLDVDPDKNITISCGSDNLFAFVMRPFLTPGENNEVMMPIPSYAHNFAVPPLIGGVCIEVPTYEEDGYDLRIEEFEKRVTPRTRIVIITNPNNPTATVYKRETLERLADFVKRHNLIMVVDQAFEDTAFDGHETVNIAALPGMQERTILLGSLSKGMALCGFRVAYVVAPDAISRMLQSCAVLFLGAPNTMAQAGAVAALKDSAFVEGYRQEYMARAEILGEILSTVPHITFRKPEGGFFFWINTSWYGTDEEVVAYLAKEANVLVSAGSMCNDPNCIRLIYGALKDRAACIDAVKRIKAALEKHPRNMA